MFSFDFMEHLFGIFLNSALLWLFLVCFVLFVFWLLNVPATW